MKKSVRYFLMIYLCLSAINYVVQITDEPNYVVEIAEKETSEESSESKSEKELSEKDKKIYISVGLIPYAFLKNFKENNRISTYTKECFQNIHFLPETPPPNTSFIF